MMEATDWRFLPYGGGLLDQPDWLMADLFTLSHEKAWIKHVQEEERKQNGA
jgi:hypothetical protein